MTYDLDPCILSSWYNTDSDKLKHVSVNSGVFSTILMYSGKFWKVLLGDAVSTWMQCHTFSHILNYSRLFQDLMSYAIFSIVIIFV